MLELCILILYEKNTTALQEKDQHSPPFPETNGAQKKGDLAKVPLVATSMSPTWQPGQLQ